MVYRFTLEPDPRQTQLITFVLGLSPESEVSLKAVEQLQNLLCSLSLSPKSQSPPGFVVAHLLIYFACQNGIFFLNLLWETHLDQAGRKLHCRQVMKDLAQDIFLLFQSFNQNCAIIVNNEILLMLSSPVASSGGLDYPLVTISILPKVSDSPKSLFKSF